MRNSCLFVYCNEQITIIQIILLFFTCRVRSVRAMALLNVLGLLFQFYAISGLLCKEGILQPNSTTVCARCCLKTVYSNEWINKSLFGCGQLSEKVNSCVVNSYHCCCNQSDFCSTDFSHSSKETGEFLGTSSSSQETLSTKTSIRDPLSTKTSIQNSFSTKTSILTSEISTKQVMNTSELFVKYEIISNVTNDHVNYFACFPLIQMLLYGVMMIFW